LFINNCDDDTVFIPTTKMLPAGTHVAFSVELADAQPMLRGLGVVKAAWPIDANRFKQVGVQIEVSQYTESSEAILGRLLAARDRAHRAANKSTPPRSGRRRAAPLTHQQWGSEIAPATMEMDCPPPAPDDAEETSISEPPRPITRQRASAAPPIRGETVEEKTSAGTPRTITRERGISRPPTDVDNSSAAPAAEMDEKTSQTIRYEGPLRTPAVPRLTPPRLTPAPRLTTPAPLPPAPRTSAPVAKSGATAQASPSDSPPPASGPTSAAAEHAPASAAVSAPVDPAIVEPVIAPPTPLAYPSANDFSSAFSAAGDEVPSLRGATPWWRTGRVIGVFAAGIVVGVLATVVTRSTPASQSPAVADRVAQQCVEDRPEVVVMASKTAPASSPAERSSDETVAATTSEGTKQVDAKPVTTTKVVAAKPAKGVETRPATASKVETKTKVAATAKPASKPVARTPRKGTRPPCASLDCI
jgi:hypothetical protein